MSEVDEFIELYGKKPIEEKNRIREIVIKAYQEDKITDAGYDSLKFKMDLCDTLDDM